MKSAEDMGKMQYQKFVVNRISSTDTAFNDTIHKNNLPLLNSITAKKSNTTSKVSNLQYNIQLFSRSVCIISCHSQESDIAHENHAWSPSLASNGILHHYDQIRFIGMFWSHEYRIQKPSQKLMSELLMVLPLCTSLIHINPVYLLGHSGTIPSWFSCPK